ncbi:hypothetical protein HJC23_004033 [Cyclotella cryptica]|uniref:SMP-LTD domain-containing protein n=1 Tax=Cyclotella cryptica TaxID=29204 RepID=A0ABD3QVY7_9STRA
MMSRKRSRPPPWPLHQHSAITRSPPNTHSTTTTTRRRSSSVVQRTSLMALTTILLSSSQTTEAFIPPTPHTKPTSLITTPKATPAIVTAASWLLTPTPSPALPLANAVSTSALQSTTAAAAAAAALVTTDTVVPTIYKAPFLSLAYGCRRCGGRVCVWEGEYPQVEGGGGDFVEEELDGVDDEFGGHSVVVVVDAVGMLSFPHPDSFTPLTPTLLLLPRTQDVLLGKEKLSGFKNRFPAALQTLKDGFAEAKRVFTESVDAIKKETQMYSAAVGLPGLIPIQYIFDRIFPSTLTAPFEGAIEDALAQTARDNTQIKKLLLKKFSMGDTAPRILEARLFDLGSNDMAFDLEMRWKSNARADLKMKVTGWAADIPVTIQNLRFEGPVRLIVLGLRPTEPGWEALLISLPRPPKIGFDLKVAGGLITQIPWLRNELEKMLDDAIAKEVLWPRRAVVSAPSPFKTKPLLNPMQMLTLMRDDPLLRRERELMASIPDDFRSNYEASSQKDTDFDIRTNGNGGEQHEDDEDEGGGDGNVPLYRRLKFWQRNKGMKHAVTADALQLFAESLREEQYASKPVLVEGVQERKGVLQKLLSAILIPRTLVSYASREAF